MNVEIRDPVAERIAVILAAIDNAKQRLDASRKMPLPERLAIALDELIKITAAKDAYDRVVKP